MVKSTDLSDMYGVAESVEDYRGLLLDLRGKMLQSQSREAEYQQQIQELDHTIDQLVDIVVQREAACHALKTLVESMVREVETCTNQAHHEWADPNLRSNTYQHRFNDEVKRLKVRYGKE
ncbi:MAG: hypothetical protein Q8O37_08340 [Sulfuricellaceae bacterium]|nr:hypothetical protein [Sulfuricellaceae bacterium]